MVMVVLVASRYFGNFVSCYLESDICFLLSGKSVISVLCCLERVLYQFYADWKECDISFCFWKERDISFMLPGKSVIAILMLHGKSVISFLCCLERV